MLTDDLVELVQRLQVTVLHHSHTNLVKGNEFPAEADPYEEHVPFFTSIPMIHPLSSAPEPKRRFVPSKWEHEKIMKIVRAIRKVCRYLNMASFEVYSQTSLSLSLSLSFFLSFFLSFWSLILYRDSLSLTKNQAAKRNLTICGVLRLRVILDGLNTFLPLKLPFQSMPSLTILPLSISFLLLSFNDGKRPIHPIESLILFLKSTLLCAWFLRTPAL